MEVPRRCCEKCGCGLVSVLQRCGECVNTYYLPCSRCGHNNAEIRPESLSHREQVDQRLIKTAAWLQKATTAHHAAHRAYLEAMGVEQQARAEYERACGQMAEAATSWAILREKGETS